MKKLFRINSIIRRPSVQLSTQASLTISAATPDSGFAFVQNSQGASAALSELSGILSTALEQFDLDDEDEGQDSSVKAQLRRIETAAGKYSNSSSTCCGGLVEWEGSASLAQLVSVAFSCAAAVYKTVPRSATVHDADLGEMTSRDGQQPLFRNPVSPGVKFTERKYTGPSLGGIEKAIGVWTADLGDVGHHVRSPSVLIIAVRGTAKLVDSLVNLNGAPTPVNDFLGVNKLPSMENTNTTISGHAGFVRCAMALQPTVQSHLSWAEKEMPNTRVIFCGHSAGGAVATLLFMKSLIEAPQSYKSLELSSITFGAPPTLNIDMTKVLDAEESLAQNRGHMLAFVDEFDMVPRVDQTYVRSLIDLYRASYNLDPIMKESLTTESSPYVLPPLEFQDEEKDGLEVKKRVEESTSNSVWNLPLPEYHVFGLVVLMRKDRHIDIKRKQGRVLKVYLVPLEEYERLLFCGTETHSRSYYADRIELLRQGLFNERETW